MSQISEGGFRTLSAFFDSEHDAKKAIDKLVDAGVARDDVRLVPGYESDTPVDDRSEHRSNFFGALANFFFPDQDRYAYAEGLSRGGYLVVLDDVSPALHDEAIDILDKHGSIDLDEREEGWRTEGWGGYAAGQGAAGSLGADAVGGAGRDNNADAQPILGTRDIGTSRPRVRSYWRQDPQNTQGLVSKTDVNIDDARDIEADRINRRF